MRREVLTGGTAKVWHLAEFARSLAQEWLAKSKNATGCISSLTHLRPEQLDPPPESMMMRERPT